MHTLHSLHGVHHGEHGGGVHRARRRTDCTPLRRPAGKRGRIRRGPAPDTPPPPSRRLIGCRGVPSPAVHTWYTGPAGRGTEPIRTAYRGAVGSSHCLYRSVSLRVLPMARQVLCPVHTLKTGSGGMVTRRRAGCGEGRSNSHDTLT